VVLTGVMVIGRAVASGAPSCLPSAVEVELVDGGYGHGQSEKY
jgi:hypothetical protein